MCCPYYSPSVTCLNATNLTLAAVKSKQYK